MLNRVARESLAEETIGGQRLEGRERRSCVEIWCVAGRKKTMQYVRAVRRPGVAELREPEDK